MITINGKEVDAETENLLEFVLDCTIEKWTEDLPGQQKLMWDHPELLGKDENDIDKLLAHNINLEEMIQTLKDLRTLMDASLPPR